MSASKRQRVIDDREYIHCVIKGPKGEIGIGPLFESEDAWPVYTISFRRAFHPTFFNLWSKMSSVMLYIDNEEKPFTNLDCPLTELEDVEFRIGDWTEEHYELRDKLCNMCDEKAISNIDAEIARLTHQIRLKEDRRAAISAKMSARKRPATRRQTALEISLKNP